MNRLFLWVVLIGGVTTGLFVGSMYITFDASDRLFDTGSYEEGIRQNGLEAEAKILSIDNALLFGGVSLNERKYLEIKMEIDNGVSSPYIVAIDTTTPYGVSINEGDTIPVRVDKNNERAVVYDFERGDIDKNKL
ncbi:MAG: hypothetical protein HQ538_04730 [Parcubacteria group bacterium]|nr:hypothetical protein [Parcubacteria group bacterium]